MTDLQALIRRSKAPEILLALRSSERHIREIQQLVGGSASTIDARVAELVEEQLVEDRQEEGWPFRRLLCLTEKGRVVASAFSDLGLSDRTTVARDIRSLGDRERSILAILHGVGGEVKGSTRLQKLVFLLTKKLDEFGNRHFSFAPYLHGPFDAQVLNDAAKLKDEGVIDFRVRTFLPKNRSEEEATDIRVRRDYVLTDEGREMGRRTFESMEREIQEAIRSLVDFNDMKLPDLLNYVYTKFPEDSISNSHDRESEVENHDS